MRAKACIKFFGSGIGLKKGNVVFPLLYFLASGLVGGCATLPCLVLLSRKARCGAGPLTYRCT